MDRKYFGVSFIYFTDGNLHSFKTLEYKFTKQKYCFRIQCNFAEKRIVLNFKKKSPGKNSRRFSLKNFYEIN